MDKGSLLTPEIMESWQSAIPSESKKSVYHACVFTLAELWRSGMFDANCSIKGFKVP